MRYWESHPPLHVMVAAYLGFEPKKKVDTSKPREVDEKVLAEIMSSFPQTTPR